MEEALYKLAGAGIDYPGLGRVEVERCLGEVMEEAGQAEVVHVEVGCDYRG